MPAPSYSPLFFATATTSGIVSTVGQQFSGAKQFLDILGLPKYTTGSLPAPAPSIEGYIAYDETTNTFKYCDGASWIAPGVGVLSIGDSVSGGTAGSILFVGSGNLLAQDNANFFWDDTNNFLGLGTATPGSPLHVTGAAVSAQADNYVSGLAVDGSYTKNNSNPRQFYVEQIKPTFNFGGSNSNTTVNLLDIDSVNTSVTGLTANLIKASYGGSERFAVASTGELRINGSAGTLGYVLTSAGSGSPPTWSAVSSGISIGDSIGSATQGSVLFAGAAGVLAQDNSNFFWDDTNNRLGIGTATPSTTLHVAGAGTITGNLTVDTNTFFVDATNNRVGVGNASPTVPLDVTGATNISGQLTLSGGLVLGTEVSGHVPATHLMQINATGTVAPLMISGGAANLQIWDAAVPTYSVAYGLAKPGDASGSNLVLATYKTGGSWETRVTISGDNGNMAVDTDTLYVDATNNRVGIGTTSPSYTFDIKKSISAGSLARIQNESSTGYSAFLYFDNAGTYKSAIGYGNSGVASPFTSSLFFNAESGVDTVWTVNSVEKMRLSASTGNFAVDTNTLYVDATNNRVGIGTSSPSTALQVTGVTTTAGLNSGANIALTGDFDILPSADNTGEIGTDALRWNRIRAVTVVTGSSLVFDNNIRPNTTDYTFEVRKANNSTVVAAFDTANGRVGIGTNTPTEALDIVGNIEVSGTITASEITLSSNVFYIGTMKIATGTAAPVSGTWTQGDRVFNSAPSAGGHAGWICVSSGTPGTWKEFGLVSE